MTDVQFVLYVSLVISAMGTIISVQNILLMHIYLAVNFCT